MKMGGIMYGILIIYIYMNNILKGLLMLGLLLSPFGVVDAQSAPTPADKLQIVNPVAGTKFKPGDTVKVSIVRGGKVVGYPVTISLMPADPSRKDLRLQVMTPGTKASDISWKVPATTKEGLYSIVATSHSVKISDKVNVEVSIPKTIQLLTLNGGEKLKVGDTVQIKWKTNIQPKSPVYMELIDTRVSSGTPRAAASIVERADGKALVSGLYSWRIPKTLADNRINQMNLNGGNVYKLRIVSDRKGNEFSAEDYSDAVFSIVDPARPPTDAPSLTVSQLAQPILPNTHVISPADGAQNISFNGFSAKSEGATSTIKDVSVKINRVGSSSLPTTVYLYDRVGTLYDSKAVLSDGIVTFNNNAIQIPKDKAIDLIVKGDVSSAAISGSRISIDITNVVTTSGTTTKTSLPLVGNTITFVNSVGNMGLATYQSIAQPTITVNNPTRMGDKPEVVTTFPLQVSAVGGNIPAPKSSDFNLVFMLGSTTIPATSVSVVTIPNNASGIAEGSMSSVTVTAVLSGSQLKSGQYYARLSNIKTTNGYTDIFTPYSAPVTISSRMGTGILSASVGIALRMAFGSVVSLFGY